MKENPPKRNPTNRNQRKAITSTEKSNDSKEKQRETMGSNEQQGEARKSTEKPLQ